MSIKKVGKKFMEIIYSTELSSPESIYALYESLGWNDFLKLSKEQLARAMEQSWYVVYAYDREKLIGTGRVVSDGIINAYLCGLGVDSAYRNQGIGTEISKRLVAHCKKNCLHTQFFCEEDLVPYYTNMGFNVFAVGMKAAD